MEIAKPNIIQHWNQKHMDKIAKFQKLKKGQIATVTIISGIQLLGDLL